jgi:eukaryotic-like serine/threonine-protein kinase
MRSDTAKAAEELQVTAPYELGAAAGTTFSINMYPVYVRGKMYLAENQGGRAIAEFQRIVDWPGVVTNEPIGALAHLGLAHAYAMQGEVFQSRTGYEDFFTLWNNADPEIPHLEASQGGIREAAIEAKGSQPILQTQPFASIRARLKLISDLPGTSCYGH